MSLDGPPELGGVTHRTVVAGGVALHVALAGDPEAPGLLLVHGWPQHWWAWRRLIGPLSQTHRVIVPDLRGFGWSGEPPAQERPFAKERLADDLLALLDVLEVERAGVVGHDWGGFAGFLACLRAPERFRALLALSIVHPWPQRGRTPDPRLILRLSYQLALASPLLGEALLRARVPVRELLRRSAGAVWSEADLELYLDRICSPSGARSSVALYRTFLTHELPRMVRGASADGRLEIPARLLVGSRDPVIDEGMLGGYEGHAPRLSVELVPGAGHFLPESHPELVLARARELFG